MPIPEFRADGYLPEGVHVCAEAEATFRFGSGGRRRQRLVLRLRRWIQLCQSVGARRFLIDGSFVTSKSEPNDIDAVVLLPKNFDDLVDAGDISALELDEMFLTRLPAELFGAEDEREWHDWREFFSRTRETDRRRKGLVEIQL